MLKGVFFNLFLLLSYSCGNPTTPKPTGELRLEYPEAQYQTFQENCPFSFEYSLYSTLEKAKEKCWYRIDYPKMKAKIALTYFPLHNDLDRHVKEVEKMVYQHTIKASSIDTKSFDYKDKKVYGNFYELKGQTASNIQFFVTDSTHHFLTGNLYFNSRPKPDSLAPAVDYIERDIMHLIDTFEWKQ